MFTATAVTLALLVTVVAQSKVYKVHEDGVTAPVVTKQVNPRFSDGARARHAQGSIELTAVVLADGTVGDVAVTKSLDPELDAEAVKAAKQWQFKPGTKDGKPVDVECTIEMTFSWR